MTKQEAKNIVVKTFEQSFDESRFLYFVKNLLNDLDESKTQVWAGNYIPESYRDAIKSYKRVGQFTDKKNNIIDVLTVNVKRDNTLERARTLQRNFIARHLKQRNHEAALVAFYTEEFEDWRFSLVIMELNLTKTRVEIELSPAKRYSFLVGKNERSHTAQNQFVNLLIDKKDKHTLNDIEQAFNIETVTKEFFIEYRDLFIKTKTSLDKILKSDSKVKEEFDKKGTDSVSFSKKLLGQIVFLYFLQKKGWFGVSKNEKWGEGSKKFLRELFEAKHGKYNNFFNDILEPLFYEALRIDRSHDDHYYSRFDCKIPFLNGGLFDPIGDYNWVQTDITLPNDLFSNNEKTDAGDTGDGILDIFDRYNFTVIEDEPLEKEVAIDPELLGKAYEKFNAIRSDNFDEYLKVLKSGKKGEETKFNKQYGVYYTPREIVHYMCRESLINYLASEFSDKSDAYQKIDLEQLDAFGNTARKGQLPLEAEYKSLPHIPKSDIESLINYGEMFGENEAVVEAKGKETDTYYYKLPESIRKNAHLIDEKLASVLICDPAVGSGAFPVGMMHEIVSTRNLLSIFIKDSPRTIYNFKRECIERSLYGVDIDAGAVEIAKLRLWLSLVVDENDITNIKPLPNLDYKIVCGDSLLKYPYKPIGLDEIEKLKQKFISETSPNKKNELRKQIDSTIYGLYKNSEKNLGYRVTMDFRINFSEVFHSNNGFDIIIANPPYIQLQKINSYSENLEKVNYNTFIRTGDIYCLFYEQGIELLKPNGILCYITSNSWMKTKYGYRLRKYFKEKTNPLKLINFEDTRVFQTVIVEANILISQKSINQYYLKAVVIRNDYNTDTSLVDYFDDFGFNITEFDENGWIILNKTSMVLKNKIEQNSKVLKEWDIKIYIGILNGFNDAYLISNKKKNELVRKNPKCNEIIKPIIRGRDVGKYYYKWDSLWLINSHNGMRGLKIKRIDVIRDYPAIYEHLLPYKSELKKRQNKGDHWTNLRNCAYFLEFEKPKIIWGELSDTPKFAYDEKGVYAEATLFAMTGSNLKYLLAILNSNLALWYFNQITTTSGMGTSRWKKYKIEQLPIILTEFTQQKKLETIVNQVLKAKERDINTDTKKLENEIDIIVYKLYNLTYGEVKIIDPNIGEIISEEDYEKFEIV